MLPAVAAGLISPTAILSRDTVSNQRPQPEPGRLQSRGLGHKFTGRGRMQLWVGGLRAGASRRRCSPPAGLSCGPGA